MAAIRTDLAMEAHACWKESAGETSELRGVIAQDEMLEGFPLTRVEIVDREGEKALGKPRGTYLTLDITRYWKHEPDGFHQTVESIAQLLETMLPEEGPVLIAGLGNQAMTPDALGPGCLSHLLITRHLKSILPGFRETAALSGGVLGTTGLEAAEWVRGAAEHMAPKAVIVVDALAARGLERVCNSIQISDTGLVPGSGVVDIETIAHDLAGADCQVPQKGFFLTPDSIDAKIRDLSKILGYGINLALQPGISTEDLDALLS